MATIMYLKYLEDEKLAIARGLVRDTTFIHKFGAVPAMSNGTTGTVWDKNNTLYPWTAFDTANVLTVSTTAANDNASTADDGMTITVIGLDENYNEHSETITIASGVGTGIKLFKRVYRAFTSATNTTIFKVSTNTIEVLRINIGNAQTLMAIYTVPGGYTGYLMKGVASCQANADATGNMFVRYNDTLGPFRVGHTFEVSGAGGLYEYNFSVPIPLPEKTDIDVRATMRTNNARLTAAFDIILVKNGGTGLRP
jgi:hypothetical protein